MPKILDYLVQEDDPDEFGVVHAHKNCSHNILHNPVFNVNMRLFKTSLFYRQIIMDVVNYMDSHLSLTYEGTASPLGVSGAKLGIPWNIIGYKCKGKNKFCINPVILRVSKETTETSTKCAALILAEDVKVLRANLVDLEYYNLKGEKIIEKNIGRFEGAFVIQHEVDHNYGVCITDRRIKENS